MASDGEGLPSIESDGVVRLLDSLGDGGWDYDVAVERLRVSPGLMELLGYAPGELGETRDTWRALVEPADLPSIRVGLELAHALDAPFNVEFRLRTKGGGVRWVQARGKAFGRDAEGRPRRVVAVVVDVTHHKESEASRLASEARFHAVFAASGSGMALVDLDGHPVESNPALCAMLGYSPEELAQKSFLEITHPDDRELDGGLFGELLRRERDSYSIDKRYLRRDGGVSWGSLVVSLVRDADDHPLYAVGMVQDITERKLAEAKQR